MKIHSVIELCLERGRAEGWDVPRQLALAVKVVGRLRPEWSESQILDSISRACGIAPVDPIEG